VHFQETAVARLRVAMRQERVQWTFSVERTVVIFPLDRAQSARDHAPTVGGPLGANFEGLIPVWPGSLTDELIRIELQTIFKAYSLSRSRHVSSSDALSFSDRAPLLFAC
jgi:hypothetical protein